MELRWHDSILEVRDAWKKLSGGGGFLRSKVMK